MSTRPHARRTTTTEEEEEEEEEEFWRQRARVLRNLSCCCSSSSSRWNGNGVLGVQKLLDRLDYCVTDSDDAFGFVQVNEREEEIENARKCFERTLRRHEMVREMEMDLLKRREFESRNTTSNNTATRLEEIFKTKKTSPILLVSKTKKEETTTTTTPLSPEMSLSPDVTNDNDTENKRKVRRRTATHPDEKTTRSPLSNVINNRRREAGKPPRGNVKRSRATDDPLVTTLTTSTKEYDNAKEDSYVCPFESSTL